MKPGADPSSEAKGDQIPDAEVIDQSPAGDLPQGQDPPEAEEVAARPAGEDHHPESMDAGASASSGRTPGLLPSMVLMLVAGLAAGAAAVYLLRQPETGDQAEIDRLSAQIEELRAAVADRGEDDEIAGAVQRLEGALSGELGGIGGTISGLTERLEKVDARMAALEAQPEPAAPAEFADAVRALQRDLASWQEEARKLRDENGRLQADLQTAQAEIAAARADLAAATGELETAREVRAVTDSERRDGLLARVAAAIAEGGTFAGAAEGYARVSGEPLPPGLVNVAGTGVPTLSALQDQFPPLAREALVAALKAQEGRGPVQKAGDFVRVQLQVRSVEPREGDGADAVLSRAQDAVGSGNLGRALEELADLPAAGQDILSGWISSASARVDAVAALEGLKP